MNKIEYIQKHKSKCIGLAVFVVLDFENDDELLHYLFDCDGYLDIYVDDSIWPADYETSEAEHDAELQVWMDAVEMCNRTDLWHELADIQAHGL